MQSSDRLDGIVAIVFWIAVVATPFLAIRFGGSATLAAVRRTLLLSAVGNVVGSLGFVVVVVQEGRPGESRWLPALVLSGLVVWGVAILALVGSTFLGAWKLWRGRGVELIGAVAVAAVASSALGVPLLAGLIPLGFLGYLFVSLGRAPAAPA